MANSSKYDSNKIPFFVIIKIGRCAVQPLMFENKVVYLKYQYLCMTDENERAYFRSAADAKMTAKYNTGWKYLGK